MLEGAVTSIVVAKDTRTRTKAKRAAKKDPVAVARVLRREIAALLEADRPDLAAIAERFESLRDLTERPDRLFAIAAEEAAALTDLFERTRSPKVYLAALECHRRLLEGDAQGTRRAGIDASVRSIERLMRLKVPAKISTLDRVRILMALARGLALDGETARALTTLDRVSRESDELPTRGGVRAVVRGEIARRGFEYALEGRDHREALRWASRRADLLASDRDAQRSGAYAEALAPLPGLCLEVGQIERAYEFADAWIAAERIAAAAGAERPSRLLEALEAASQSATALATRADAIDADHSRAIDAAMRHTDEAVQVARNASSDSFEFVHTRALEALAHEVEVVTHLPNVDEARLHTLAEYGRSLGAPGLETRVHLAHLARLVSEGDWLRIAPVADAIVAGDLPSSGILAVAVRSHFARGEDDRVRDAGKRYFESLDVETDPAECAAVLSLVAAAEARVHARTEVDTERDRLARELLVRVHAISARVRKIPRLARDGALAGALLSARAAAEHQAGLEGLARRDARDAAVRIRTAKTLPIETAAFTAWMHEMAGHEDLLRRIEIEDLDAVGLSARALGAAQRGDVRRAMALCGALRAESLGEHAEALAHGVTALTLTLKERAPADKLVLDGVTASEDLSGFATLPILRERLEPTPPGADSQNGVDALDAGE